MSTLISSQFSYSWMVDNNPIAICCVCQTSAPATPEGWFRRNGGWTYSYFCEQPECRAQLTAERLMEAP